MRWEGGVSGRHPKIGHIIARPVSILFDTTIALYGLVLLQMAGQLKHVSLAAPVVRKYHLRFIPGARRFSAAGLFLDIGRGIKDHECGGQGRDK